ncbi:MAG: hypothetical protein COV31_02570 [Candidatus Yanofskybacteria bacterium CG10_big_fil_rev_8_21_14_0_10_46_23]|uniref:Bacterial type II secretion system protein E domain-containing protein n=1 Tax=Candidatus Yanofskybacteria bacterium CG10_big_fil_rev_8_21_14_0_10_46_23 TaxID=1975098 RepID=A0A2H0R627_9BACT|nr:MAG: hypothetical protein COV31_02570 [Candidatus Yanofskybacteria bacterium CG10_big_fil_rev_8_21_14_0_10_46_23]
MKKFPQALADYLVAEKVIPKETLSRLQEEMNQSQEYLGEILIRESLIDDLKLRALKAKLYHLPEANIADLKIDREVGKEISADVINFYGIIPFQREAEILRVGILNPENFDALEALKFIGEDKKIQIEKYVISHADFSKLLREYSSLKSEVGQALENITAPEGPELKLNDKVKIEEITAEAPITRIVAVVVRHAVESRASDIHIEPFEDKIRIRFRVDGVLQSALSLPKDLLPAIVTRVKILANLKIDEARLPQDGRFSTHLEKRKIDFRVSILPTKTGEKVVMRILDPIADISLESLGFMGRNLAVILRVMDNPFGQILITGPTGSGKSTTLYAMLAKLNVEGVNITTLEDPVEYFVEGVNQSQVHEEIGFTFANGLRSILRQDPDIVMVGEIRDGETAALATQAALTGHLVLSTLHTNDAIGVIPRLVNMGVEKYLLAPTLSLAMGQRLLRRLCPSCRVADKPNVGEKEIIDKALAQLPKQAKAEVPEERLFFRPAKEGCKKCGGKAYSGRVAIVEALEMTDELEKVVLGSLSEQAMRREAFNQGMMSMFQDGIMKVLRGVTSLAELLQVAQMISTTVADEATPIKSESEKIPGGPSLESGPVVADKEQSFGV